MQLGRQRRGDGHTETHGCAEPGTRSRTESTQRGIDPGGVPYQPITVSRSRLSW
jgi:hypothetical protein